MSEKSHVYGFLRKSFIIPKMGVHFYAPNKDFGTFL